MPMRRRTRTALRRTGLVALLAALVATATVNGLVRWVSGSGPWLLDPRHLGAKAHALVLYARHRPLCLLLSHATPAERVAAAARKSGVDPDLLEAMLRVESGGEAHRISPTGACGPAQLMPGTARLLGVRDPFDPEQAVDGGARYLREQLDRYKGNRALALAAYNAGPGAVKGTIPINGETEVYVPRVLAAWKAIRAERRRPAAAQAPALKPPAPAKSPSTTSPARHARPRPARAPGRA